MTFKEILILALKCLGIFAAFDLLVLAAMWTGRWHEERPLRQAAKRWRQNPN
jgi:hypothetical protein